MSQQHPVRLFVASHVRKLYDLMEDNDIKRLASENPHPSNDQLSTWEKTKQGTYRRTPRADQVSDRQPEDVALTPYPMPQHMHPDWDEQMRAKIAYAHQVMQGIDRLPGGVPASVAGLRLPGVPEAIKDQSFPIALAKRASNIEQQTDARKDSKLRAQGDLEALKRPDSSILAGQSTTTWEKMETARERSAKAQAVLPQVNAVYSALAQQLDTNDSEISDRMGTPSDEQWNAVMGRMHDQQGNLTAEGVNTRLLNGAAGTGKTNTMGNILVKESQEGTPVRDMVLTSPTHNGLNAGQKAIKNVLPLLSDEDQAAMGERLGNNEPIIESRTQYSLAFNRLKRQNVLATDGTYMTPLEAIGRSNYVPIGLPKRAEAASKAKNLEELGQVGMEEQGQLDYLRQLYKEQGIKGKGFNPSQASQYIMQKKANRVLDTAGYKETLDYGEKLWYQGEKQKPEAVLWVYEQSINMRNGFGLKDQKKPYFDLQDTLHMATVAAKKGFIEPISLINDEYQDNDPSTIAFYKAITDSPTSHALFAGDPAQKTFAESNRFDVGAQIERAMQSRQKAEKTFAKYDLTGNFRQDKGNIAFMNALYSEAALNGKERPAYQTSMRKGAGTFPQLSWAPTAESVYGGRIQHLFEQQLKLSMGDIRANMEANPKRPALHGAAMSPGEAPFIASMGEQVLAYEKTARTFLTHHLGEDMADKVMQEAFSKDHPTTENLHKIRALRTSQARSMSFDEPTIDASWVGKWNYEDYLKQVGVMASRARGQQYIIGSGSQFGVTKHNNSREAFENQFLPIMSRAVSNYVDIQGGRLSDVPKQYQRFYNTPFLPPMRELPDHNEAAISTYIDFVKAAMSGNLVQAQVGDMAFMPSPEDAEESLSFAEGYDPESDTGDARYDGFSVHSLSAGAIAGKNSLGIDAQRIELAHGFWRALIEGGPEALKAYGLTDIPNPFELLERGHALFARPGEDFNPEKIAKRYDAVNEETYDKVWNLYSTQLLEDPHKAWTGQTWRDIIQGQQSLHAEDTEAAIEGIKNATTVLPEDLKENPYEAKREQIDAEINGQVVYQDQDALKNFMQKGTTNPLFSQVREGRHLLRPSLTDPSVVFAAHEASPGIFNGIPTFIPKKLEKGGEEQGSSEESMSMFLDNLAPMRQRGFDLIKESKLLQGQRGGLIDWGASENDNELIRRRQEGKAGKHSNDIRDEKRAEGNRLLREVNEKVREMLKINTEAPDKKKGVQPNAARVQDAIEGFIAGDQLRAQASKIMGDTPKDQLSKGQQEEIEKARNAHKKGVGKVWSEAGRAFTNMHFSQPEHVQSVIDVLHKAINPRELNADIAAEKDPDQVKQLKRNQQQLLATPENERNTTREVMHELINRKPNEESTWGESGPVLFTMEHYQELARTNPQEAARLVAMLGMPKGNAPIPVEAHRADINRLAGTPAHIAGSGKAPATLYNFREQHYAHFTNQFARFADMWENPGDRDERHDQESGGGLDAAAGSYMRVGSYEGILPAGMKVRPSGLAIRYREEAKRLRTTNSDVNGLADQKEAQAAQIEQFLSHISNPANHRRYGHLQNLIARATMGANPGKIEKGSITSESPFAAFYAHQSNEYAPHQRTLEGAMGYVSALNRAMTHMQKTGTLRYEHVTDVLKGLGHSPDDELFQGLRVLERQHGYGRTMQDIPLETLLDEYPKQAGSEKKQEDSEKRTFYGEFSRYPFVPGETVSFTGDATGPLQQGLTPGMLGSLQAFPHMLMPQINELKKKAEAGEKIPWHQYMNADPEREAGYFGMAEDYGVLNNLGLLTDTRKEEMKQNKAEGVKLVSSMAGVPYLFHGEDGKSYPVTQDQVASLFNGQVGDMFSPLPLSGVSSSSDGESIPDLAQLAPAHMQLPHGGLTDEDQQLRPNTHGELERTLDAGHFAQQTTHLPRVPEGVAFARNMEDYFDSLERDRPLHSILPQPEGANVRAPFLPSAPKLNMLPTMPGPIDLEHMQQPSAINTFASNFAADRYWRAPKTNESLPRRMANYVPPASDFAAMQQQLINPRSRLGRMTVPNAINRFKDTWSNNRYWRPPLTNTSLRRQMREHVPPASAFADMQQQLINPSLAFSRLRMPSALDRLSFNAGTPPPPPKITPDLREQMAATEPKKMLAEAMANARQTPALLNRVGGNTAIGARLRGIGQLIQNATSRARATRSTPATTPQAASGEKAAAAPLPLGLPSPHTLPSARALVPFTGVERGLITTPPVLPPPLRTTIQEEPNIPGYMRALPPGPPPPLGLPAPGRGRMPGQALVPYGGEQGMLPFERAHRATGAPIPLGAASVPPPPLGLPSPHKMDPRRALVPGTSTALMGLPPPVMPEPLRATIQEEPNLPDYQRALPPGPPPPLGLYEPLRTTIQEVPNAPTLGLPSGPLPEGVTQAQAQAAMGTTSGATTVSGATASAHATTHDPHMGSEEAEVPPTLDDVKKDIARWATQGNQHPDPEREIVRPSQDEQLPAILSGAQARLIRGGPGGGKTSTLVSAAMHAMATDPTMTPQQILSLTAVNSGKDALNAEYKKYREGMPQGEQYNIPAARTFHQVAHGVVFGGATEDPGTGQVSHPNLAPFGMEHFQEKILENLSQEEMEHLNPSEREEARRHSQYTFLSQALERSRDANLIDKDVTPKMVSQHLEEIAKLKKQRLGPNEEGYQTRDDPYYQALLQGHRDRRAGVASHQHSLLTYEEDKDTAGIMDYDDMLYHGANILEQQGLSALPEWMQQLRILTLDEGQDFTRDNKRFTQGMLGALKGNNPKFMVGYDTAQSLFENMGGYKANEVEGQFRNMIRDGMGVDDPAHFTLHKNFRSDAWTVAMNNALLKDESLKGQEVSPMQIPGRRERGAPPEITMRKSQPVLYREMLKSMVASTGVPLDTIKANLKAGNTPFEGIDFEHTEGLTAPKQIPGIAFMNNQIKMLEKGAHLYLQDEMGLSPSQAKAAYPQMFRKGNLGKKPTPLERSQDPNLFHFLKVGQARSLGFMKPHVDLTRVGGWLPPFGKKRDYIKSLFVGNSRERAGGGNTFFAATRPFDNRKRQYDQYLAPGGEQRFVDEEPENLFNGKVMQNGQPVPPSPDNAYQMVDGKPVPQVIAPHLKEAAKQVKEWTDQGLIEPPSGGPPPEMPSTVTHDPGSASSAASGGASSSPSSPSPSSAPIEPLPPIANDVDGGGRVIDTATKGAVSSAYPPSLSDEEQQGALQAGGTGFFNQLVTGIHNILTGGGRAHAVSSAPVQSAGGTGGGTVKSPVMPTMEISEASLPAIKDVMKSGTPSLGAMMQASWSGKGSPSFAQALRQHSTALPQVGSTPRSNAEYVAPAPGSKAEWKEMLDTMALPPHISPQQFAKMGGGRLSPSFEQQIRGYDQHYQRSADLPTFDQAKEGNKALRDFFDTNTPQRLKDLNVQVTGQMKVDAKDVQLASGGGGGGGGGNKTGGQARSYLDAAADAAASEEDGTASVASGGGGKKKKTGSGSQEEPPDFTLNVGPWSKTWSKKKKGGGGGGGSTGGDNEEEDANANGSGSGKDSGGKGYNVFQRFGHEMARIGNELQFVGIAASQITQQALKAGSDYRHSTGLMNMGGASGTEGAMDFYNGNSLIGQMSSTLPMYSKTELVKALQEVSSSMNVKDAGSVVAPTESILGMSALTGLSSTELTNQLMTITGSVGKGQNVAAIPAINDQIAGMYGGNVSAQNVGPTLTALQAILPQIQGAHLGSPDQSSNILKLFGSAVSPLGGMTAQNLPDVAQMMGSLNQIGMAPDLQQQNFLSQLFGPQHLTAAPQMAQYQAQRSEEQMQVQQLQLRQNYDAEGIQINLNNADIRMERANLDTQQLDLQMANATITTQKLDLQMAQEQLSGAQLQQSYDVASYNLKQRTDSELYGDIGQDTSRSGYFNFMRAQQAAGYNATSPETSQNFKPGSAFGIENAKFYAGVEHSRQDLVLGRSSLLSDAKFQEDNKYLNQQETFYNEELKVRNEQRSFERDWTKKLLDKHQEQLNLQYKQVAQQAVVLGLQEQQVKQQGVILGLQEERYGLDVQRNAYENANLELQKSFIPKQIENLNAMITAMDEQMAGQGPIDHKNVSALDIIKQLSSIDDPSRRKDLIQMTHLNPNDQKYLYDLIDGIRKNGGYQKVMDGKTPQDKDLQKKVQDLIKTGAFAGDTNNAQLQDAMLNFAGQGDNWKNLISSANTANGYLKEMAKDLSFIAGVMPMVAVIGTVVGPLLTTIGTISNIIGVMSKFSNFMSKGPLAPNSFDQTAPPSATSVETGAPIIETAAPLIAGAAPLIAGAAPLIASGAPALEAGVPALEAGTVPLLEAGAAPVVEGSLVSSEIIGGGALTTGAEVAGGTILGAAALPAVAVGAGIAANVAGGVYGFNDYNMNRDLLHTGKDNQWDWGHFAKQTFIPGYTAGQESHVGWDLLTNPNARGQFGAEWNKEVGGAGQGWNNFWGGMPWNQNNNPLVASTTGNGPDGRPMTLGPGGQKNKGLDLIPIDWGKVGKSITDTWGNVTKPVGTFFTTSLPKWWGDRANEWQKNMWGPAGQNWNNFAKGAQNMWGQAGQKWNEFAKGAQNMWGQAGQFWNDLPKNWQKNVWGPMGQMFNNIGDGWQKNVWKPAVQFWDDLPTNWQKKVWDPIVSKFNEGIKNLKDLPGTLSNNFKDSIKNFFNIPKGKSLWDTILEKATSFFHGGAGGGGGMTSYGGGSGASTVVDGITMPHINTQFHQPLWYGLHQGLDYQAAQGTPLREFVGGVVQDAGWKPWGGEVDVRLPGGYIERYLHLSNINVHRGQSVGRGQSIGSTGGGTIQSGLGWWSQGSHLHYQIDRGNINAGINPVPLLKMFHETDIYHMLGRTISGLGSANSGLGGSGGVGLNLPEGAHAPQSQDEIKALIQQQQGQDQGQGAPSASNPMGGDEQRVHFSEGGIAMQRMHAVLSELEPEAVIPLSRFSQVLDSVSQVAAKRSQNEPASGGGAASPTTLSISKLADKFELHVHTSATSLDEQAKDELMAQALDIFAEALKKFNGR